MRVKQILTRNKTQFTSMEMIIKIFKIHKKVKQVIGLGIIIQEKEVSIIYRK